MTNLKREKNEMEREYLNMKEKLDDYFFMNQKLDETLKAANEKIQKLENELSKL